MPTRVHLFLDYLPPGLEYYREAHPYGPGRTGGFNTDLAIEIDPGQVNPFGKALAVTDGIIRFISDLATGTGSLVLKPEPQPLKDLNDVLGTAGSFVFVYRNLDTASVKAKALAYIRAVGDRPFFTKRTPEERVEFFLNGFVNIRVAGGAELGTASTVGGNNGFARLGFEIVFLPGGLGPDREGTPDVNEGWERVKELIAPSIPFLTRRLDPMHLYAVVASSQGSARLDPTHNGHILLSLPTRRILIEVRDEYDEPFLGPVTIQENSGPPKVEAPSSNGTFVKQEFPRGANVNPFSYEITIPHHVLTKLPSGDSANERVIQMLQAPAHLSLQAIYMHKNPPSIEEGKSWFVANVSPLERFTDHNTVTPIRDGLEESNSNRERTGMLRQYADAMRTVTSDGHFIYLAGWILVDGFPLDPKDASSTANRLMIKATTDPKKGQVFAMLWDTKLSTINTDEVGRINALPNHRGHAILDEHPLQPGAHHQKFMVINGSAGAFAFCGGMDINSDRRDSPKHLARGGFHDVHAKVTGPAVVDIARSFVDRWNNHPLRGAHSQLPDPQGLFTPSATVSGTVYVQVARTYAPRARYPFAPAGSLTIREAFLQAIRKARKFIYIEDQYLTPYAGTDPATGLPDKLGVLTALKEALQRIDYLLMLIPNHVGEGLVLDREYPEGRYRRQQFIEALLAAEAALHLPSRKVFVFYLSRNTFNGSRPDEADQGGCPHCSGNPSDPKLQHEIYIHTKIWIVDDICAKIGSANCNRRSYTHDSEMDLILVDGAVDNGARRIARNLRMDLWSEHLNLGKGQRAWLADHKHALSFWLKQGGESHVAPYKHNDEVVKPSFPNFFDWDNKLDPDGQ